MIACAAATLVAAPAKAQYILNNLSPGGTETLSDKTYGNISRWAQEFTASATGTISNVKLNLYRTNAQSGAFSVEIWSDAGTLPGSSLSILKTLDWANVVLNNTATTTSDYTDISTFDDTYAVESGTTYWLVVNQASNGPQAKRWTSNGTGIGNTASYNSPTSAWTSAGSDTNLGSQITVVPEPRAVQLVVLAAMGFLAWSRLRGPCRRGQARG